MKLSSIASFITFATVVLPVGARRPSIAPVRSPTTSSKDPVTFLGIAGKWLLNTCLGSGITVNPVTKGYSIPNQFYYNGKGVVFNVPLGSSSCRGLTPNGAGPRTELKELYGFDVGSKAKGKHKLSASMAVNAVRGGAINSAKGCTVIGQIKGDKSVFVEVFSYNKNGAVGFWYRQYSGSDKILKKLSTTVSMGQKFLFEMTASGADVTVNINGESNTLSSPDGDGEESESGAYHFKIGSYCQNGGSASGSGNCTTTVYSLSTSH